MKIHYTFTSSQFHTPPLQLFPSKGQVGSQFKRQCMRNNACRVLQSNCIHGHTHFSDHRCESDCPRLLRGPLRSCVRVPGGSRETCRVRDVLITQECQVKLCLCVAVQWCKLLKEVPLLPTPLLCLFIRPFLPSSGLSLVIIRGDSSANRLVKLQGAATA